MIRYLGILKKIVRRVLAIFRRLAILASIMNMNFITPTEHDEKPLWYWLAIFVFFGTFILLMVSLFKGFYFSPTTEAIARSEHGQKIAIFAAPGLVFSIVAMLRPLTRLHSIVSFIFFVLAVVIWQFFKP